ncbi:DNA replication/repair protein RecF [Pectinatus brassicae]|uniref:DNA replication and repair protein RecF n=1 Tax=Pectinatus brassicae TaxID=862415 RepID=A0A840UIJ5_9FIRM|nr:DNA replication/repair protein RecF [Pectinatus brassicae]MBB5336936.1 DNA replication and repair protein RecF [Pectinatus brassicae]
MNIGSIFLRNFRNYKELKLNLSPSLNIFIGNNAQGKTNIIESIYYAALGTSYRIKNDNDLINWQDNEAFINIDFTRLDIDNNIKFHLNKLKRRQILLNGDNIRQKDLPGTLTTVLFSPEDLLIIKGAPALRRRFLDIELSQTNLSYYNNLVKFNKIIVQRNNLLKKIREHKQKAEMLDMWDAQLIPAASFIWEKRWEAVKKISSFAAVMQDNISNNQEKLLIKYKIFAFEDIANVSGIEEAYKDKLYANRFNDIRRGATGIGPHHDDLELFVNNINLKNFGSQGQQRTAVLSLKLAELEYIKDTLGQYPVLLLDDVMSELDINRREKMVLFFRDKNIQTFITATDKDMFSNISKAKLYSVTAGNVEVING